MGMALQEGFQGMVVVINDPLNARIPVVSPVLPPAAQQRPLRKQLDEQQQRADHEQRLQRWDGAPHPSVYDHTVSSVHNLN
eukprot:gene5257-3386_t